MPFAATWLDREIIILNEVSQTKTNIIWYHLYVEYKKNDTNKLVEKINGLTDIENKLSKGETIGGD